MIKITTKIQDDNLSEIYQSMQAKTALCRPNGKSYERITPLVLCRDFLCDVYTFADAKRDFSIYGMTFKGSTEKPHWDGVFILIQFPNKTAQNSFVEHLPLLNKIEKGNNFKESYTEKVEGKPLEFLVVGDKKWLMNCLSFSMYTLLLRVLCYTFSSEGDWLKKFSTQDNSDARYIKSVSPAVWKRVFDDITSIKTDEWCGFDAKKDHVGQIHHNSGFVSVFGTHTEINRSCVKKNKHWQEMQRRGFELATK